MVNGWHFKNIYEDCGQCKENGRPVPAALENAAKRNVLETLAELPDIPRTDTSGKCDYMITQSTKKCKYFCDFINVFSKS